MSALTPGQVALYTSISGPTILAHTSPTATITVASAVSQGALGLFLSIEPLVLGYRIEPLISGYQVQETELGYQVEEMILVP